MKKLAAALIVLVMVSGCIESIPSPSDIILAINNMFKTYYGEDVIKVKKTDERVGPINVLGVAKASILPRPPLLPDQYMTYMLLLENTDADPSKPIENVSVELYDAPNFKDIEEKDCNQNTCFPEICREDQKCFMPPGGETAVEFKLKTPTQEESKKIKTAPTLSYRILYDFETRNSFTFSVINSREIERRQRSQSPVQLYHTLVTSSGPVSLSADLEGPSYVLAGQNAVIVFHIVNKGDGSPQNSQIDAEQVEISFPEKILVSNGMNIGGTEVFVHEKIGEASCTSFHNDCVWGTGDETPGKCLKGYKYCLPCSATKWNGLWRTCTTADNCEFGSGLTPENNCANELKCCVPLVDKNTDTRQYRSPYFICDKGVCKNRGPIELYEGISAPLYFVIKNVPDVDVFETFTVIAKIRYQYELRGSERVEIKPYGT